jgi:superfamily II DNA or RNA helicase
MNIAAREAVKRYKQQIVQYLPSHLAVLSHPSVRVAKLKTRDAAVLRASWPSFLRPKPHQDLVRRHMQTNSGLLVVHGTGTGKTLTASFVARDFLSVNRDGMVIIVSPPGVKAQFYAEIGTAVPPEDMPRVFAFGFDELVNLARSKNGERLRDVMRVYKTLMIIDEAHYLNKQDSSRASALLDLTSLANKVLAMTATPVTNQVNELATLLAFVGRTKALASADLMKMSDAEFSAAVKCRISVYENDPNSTNFPKMVEHAPILIPLSGKNYANAALNYKEFTMRVRYANERVKLVNQGAKLQKIYELMLAHPGKTIVYAEMKQNVAALKSFLDDKGVPYETIVGNTSPSKRPNMVKRFSEPDDGRLSVMILSKAGQAGLDFKRVRNVIFLELPWNYSDYKQIVGRAVRYQSHPDPGPRAQVNVFVVLYTAPPGQRPVFNQQAYRYLQEKKQRTEKIMARVMPLTIERAGACRAKNSGGGGMLRRVLGLKVKPDRVRASPEPEAPVSPQVRNAVRGTLKTWLTKMMARASPKKPPANSNNANVRKNRTPLRRTESMRVNRLTAPVVLERVRSSPALLDGNTGPRLTLPRGVQRAGAKRRRGIRMAMPKTASGPSGRVHPMITRSRSPSPELENKRARVS